MYFKWYILNKYFALLKCPIFDDKSKHDQIFVNLKYRN